MIFLLFFRFFPPFGLVSCFGTSQSINHETSLGNQRNHSMHTFRTEEIAHLTIYLNYFGHHGSLERYLEQKYMTIELAFYASNQVYEKHCRYIHS